MSKFLIGVVGGIIGAALLLFSQLNFYPKSGAFFTQGINSQWTTSGSNIYNNNSGSVGIGTTTPVVKLVVNNEPNGNGTAATTTVTIGDVSTTTARSSIQMVNSSGSAECVYLVGSTLTVTAGICN